MYIDQPDLCVRAGLALVQALDEKNQAGEKMPRVIAISSMGLGDQHAIMPFTMRVRLVISYLRPACIALFRKLHAPSPR